MPVTDFGDAGNNNDWLQSLLAAFGAGQPNAPGAAPGVGAGPQGVMPGGAPMGYQAAAPGPPMGQPPGSPMFQFGGFHPGNILQGHPPNSPTLGPIFNASGSPGGPAAGPGGPGTAGNDGGFNNPYAAAAAANPSQGGPYVGSGPPGPQATAMTQPQHPSTMRYPSWPTPGAGTAGPTPTGSPSDTPRPGGSSASSGTSPLPPPRPKNFGVSTGGQGYAPSAPSPVNNRFTTVQYQTPGSVRGPLSNSPIYTALNLFGGGQSAAAPANPANVPASAAMPVSGQLPGGRSINPQPPGGPPDYGMAPADITGYPVRGVNAPLFAALRGKKIPNPGGWYGS